MLEHSGGGWRCRSCGFENDVDAPSCVYCGEINADEQSAFDELEEEEFDEDY